MDNIWTSVCEDRDLLKHLPDHGEIDKELSREFAFIILTTLRPGYVRQVVEHAISLKQTSITTNITPEKITIKDDILDALSNCPAKPVSKLIDRFLYECRAREGSDDQGDNQHKDNKRQRDPLPAP